MSEFSDYFQTIATKFLKSVLVVDDEIIYGDKEKERRAHHQGASSHEDNISPEPSVPKDIRDLDEKAMPTEIVTRNDLNAKEITEEFARKGMFCSIIDPTNAGRELAATLSESADIVVLDWWVGKDDGATVLSLIEEMIQEDEFERLRLIAIYTGRGLEEELVHIREELLKKFEAIYPGRFSKCGEYCIQADATRIKIYGKRHEVEDEKIRGLEEQSLGWRELAPKLISDFAELYQGLVPAVVLSALSTVRERSWRLGRSFDQRLDPAYLWHRGALTVPEEAENQLLTMVTAEIESILMDSEAGKAADISAISKWLDTRGPADWKEALGSHTDLTKDDVVAMLQEGAEKVGNPPCYLRKKAFCASKEGMDRSNILYAQRSSLKTEFGTPAPSLRLGTILYSTNEVAEKEYYLCLQPVCDSERIAGKRFFPLLRCKMKQGLEPPFSYVVDGPDKANVFLKALIHPYDLRVVEFAASGARNMVATVKEDDQKIFQSADGTRYTWVAELKQAHAQRLAQQFSDVIGRVGLDESEWLRLANQGRL